MGIVRVEKMQEFIKQELSQIITREMKDPRIGFATITNVIVAGDLRQAKVFVSILGKEEQKQEGIQALIKATGFLRSELAHRMKVRFAPELVIKLDENLDYSLHVNKLLKKVEKVGSVEEDGSDDSEG